MSRASLSLLSLLVGGAAGALGGCTEEKGEATASLATVMTVTWETSEPGSSVVEWGYDESYVYQTLEATDSVTEHRVVVAGMAPGRRVYWRARSEVAGGTWTSEGHIVDIPEGYATLSPVTLDQSAPGFTRGFRLIPVSGHPSGVILVDDGGEEVWAVAVAEGLTPMQAWLDHDGTHVLYLIEDTRRTEDVGGIVRISLDQSEVEYYPLHYAHHGFLQMADGAFLYLATDPREVDGVAIAGDALMRVDADGLNPTMLYSTWDQFTPDVAALQKDGGIYYPDWLDWTHANAINWRPDGTLLLSLHNISTIVNLELGEGDAPATVRWTMVGAGNDAGTDGDFDYQGAFSDLFDRQHHPVATDAGILVFDNGANVPGEYSEAVEYAVDEAARTFTPVWDFEWGQAVQVPFDGDVQRLASGNTLIDWGSASYVTEVTPAGEIVWQINNAGQIIGFMQQYAQIGGPVP